MGVGSCGAPRAPVLCQHSPFAEQFWALLLDLPRGLFLPSSDPASTAGKGWSILVRESEVPIQLMLAQIPRYSSQKQQFFSERHVGQKSTEGHVGLINISVAPQGTFPSTEWSNYPQHSRGPCSSHSSGGRMKVSRSQAAESTLVPLPKAGAGENSVLAWRRCVQDEEIICQDMELWIKRENCTTSGNIKKMLTASS